MNIAALLSRTAALTPDAPALFSGTRLVATYRQWADRSAALAASLLAPIPEGGCGLAPGDRVALFMTNCPDYLDCLFGVLWAGLTAVPVNAKLHPRELLYVLENSGSRAVIVTPDLADAVLPELPALQTPPLCLVSGSARYDALFDRDGRTSSCPEAEQRTAARRVADRSPTDTAWLFYTSGTTGTPKGVMISHRMLQGMTSCYFSDVDPVDPQDAIVYAAPMSHGAGLYTFPHVLAGARHVIPASGGFDPAELCSLAQDIGHLSLFAAPTMVKRLVTHCSATGSGTSGFKTIIYGGGPMYAEDIQQALTVMGDRFVQIYGQGECPMTITVLPRRILSDRQHPRRAERIASVGYAQSLVEVRIAGPDGTALPPGVTGEVLVRGDIVMTGYWNTPVATAQTLRDGWLWTGDMGSLDEDGFLTLKDRSKDVIISGGSNIYPREVEEVLLRHPQVEEASVVGCPDPEWGEVVVAFIVGTAPPEELDQLCLASIARFKRPKTYRYVDALPKNNYGKVLKTTLRTLLSPL